MNSIPNADLLTRTFDFIRQNPERWNQALYRQGSGDTWVGCFAAWACELAGGTWSGWVCLVAEPDDNPADVVADVIDCERRAQRLLGLGHDEAHDLFNPNNNLAYIADAIAELCERAELLTAARAVDQAPVDPHQTPAEQKLRAAMHATVDHIEPKDTTR